MVAIECFFSKWTITDWTAAGVGVALVAVVATALIGILQTRRMKQAWQAQAALEISRDLQSVPQRDARRTIYSLKANGVPYSSWNIRQQHRADAVFQQLNTAAYLADQGLLPRKVLIDLWGDTFWKASQAASDRINDRERKGDRGLWPHYRKVVEELGDRPPSIFFAEGVDEKDLQTD